VSADAYPAGEHPAVLRVESALLPYLSRGGYASRRLELDDAARARGGRPRGGSASPYGPDLLAEVARYASSTRAIAAAGGFDVVHAHDWMTFPAGIAAKEASGAPLVAHVHATEHDRAADSPDPAIRAVEEAGLRAADRVICVSRRSAGDVTARYRVDARKLRVVHNGLVPLRAPRRRRTRGRGEGPVVLFLGRVTSQKGPIAFLDAAKRVLERIPRATFVVAGGGDLLPAAIEHAARLRIARRVRFAGFLRGADVAAAYASADVFVMPSRSEPFGIAPLEAMSLGVPAVVSSASGVCEVVENVLQVPPGRPATLARALVDLLRDPRRRARMARDGRREARALSWDAPAGKVLAVYEEAAA
jgi:glycogen synthase